MSKSVAGPEIEKLIQLLARVPGLGPRSARRAALHLIKKKDQVLAPLAEAMAVARDSVTVCSTCGNGFTCPDTSSVLHQAPVTVDRKLCLKLSGLLRNDLRCMPHTWTGLTCTFISKFAGPTL